MELTKWEWMKKLSEYLPSMKLDGYSFKLCQERVDNCHTQGFFPLFHLSTPLHTTDKWLTLKYDESLTCLGCPTVSLTYPHIPDKARMNNHQASYLVSIHLIFAFEFFLKRKLLSQE